MSIRLERLVKRYDEQTVVHDLSLDLDEGELFVLLGPSGSGKSTVLRMIAGLTPVDGGRVRLRGVDVTELAPQRRGVGMVFQHYALFRHMTVADNVEFALRVKGRPAAERRRRRDDLLELVGLAGFAERYPDQLSGGQAQRVAIARALAHRPQILLLDEPFGALDARIRTELRQALRHVQRELSVTTLFVTHDQDEAFELADRLGVMSAGRLLEVGSPHELYLRPETEFVATFLGRANLLIGETCSGGVRLGSVAVPLAGTESPEPPRRVQLLFRPEDVAIKLERGALEWPALGRAVVVERLFSGSVERLRLRLPALEGVRAIAPPQSYGQDQLEIEAARSQHQARRFAVEPGAEVWVGVRRLHALTHPGLQLLIVDDGTEHGERAARLGLEIARRAHARAHVLKCGPDPAEAIAEECARRPYDLRIGAGPSGSAPCPDAACEGVSVLRIGDRTVALPRRMLLCAAVGEPAKSTIEFGGRLARHLGASAVLLSVLPGDAGQDESAQAERFLAAGVKTLARWGVRARAAVRRGQVREEIERESIEGGHELVVIGDPEHATTRELMQALRDRCVLVVRAGRPGGGDARERRGR